MDSSPEMSPVTFEQSIRLKNTKSPNVYEAVQRPLWAWPGSGVVPGGIIMPIAVNAAYQTVPEDFTIDSVHAHFVAASQSKPVLIFRVDSISDGGRFALRLVHGSQDGKPVFQATCSFVRAASLQKGQSMRHSITRATTQTIDAITLDDLSINRNELGPWMKYQRLPLEYTGPGELSSNPRPELIIYTSVAQLSTPPSTNSRRLQSLGIIALSDYHVLDCPPTVHGLNFGVPAIGDKSQTGKPHDFQMLTSLNHSIHFHLHDGFRADDLCYIEAHTPWANSRRAEINTKIFSKDGRLVATCKQEGYYAMKEKSDGARL